MKRNILWILAAAMLILSVQGCFVVDPGWGGHRGHGGYEGGHGHGHGHGHGGHHR